jgi:GTP cyclohydrolase I
MTPQNTPIPDVQNSVDTRQLAINKVGIKSIRHPVKVQDQSVGIQHTIAVFNMYVGLPHNFKGTHMSRFVGTAPVSGVQSLMDYDVTFIGDINGGKVTTSVKVVVPVTSLCPCSKKISEYGAHNQRSHVTVTAKTNDFVWIEELVRLVEDEASCELFGLLKRPDEKFVTERAYDNPKFVEDMVRDVAARLNAEVRVDAYVVESENFESIHNHSAYALIEKDKTLA